MSWAPQPCGHSIKQGTPECVLFETSPRPLCSCSAAASEEGNHRLLFSAIFVRPILDLFHPGKSKSHPGTLRTSIFVLALSFVSQTFPSWESMKLCLPLDQPQLPHETCSARARTHLCGRWLEEHALMKSTPLSRGDSQDLPMRKFRSRLLASRAVSDL